jgi:hypothetical protein
MDPNIRDYIRANTGRYTPEAIRANLIAAGHDPAAIDAEFAAIAAGWDARSSGSDGLLSEAWILFIVGGVAGLAGFGMAASFGSGGFFPIFAVGYLGIGFGIILLLRWAVPRFHIKGLWAGLLGLVLVPVFGALMFGTCAAAFAVGRG